MNQMNRRSFIKTGSLALTGLAFASCGSGPKRTNDKILGLQLYSVRADMKSDPLSTLRQLSEIGYKYLEHAGYENRAFYGYKPKEFKSVLDDLGMKMPSGHDSIDMHAWDKETNEFMDRWKFEVEDSLAVGQQYLISPWFDKEIQTSYELLMPLLEVYNKFGEYCKKQGLKFGYHNDFEHNYDLNGKKIFDIIMETCNPEFVYQQLDIGNLVGEGLDPLKVLDQYKGRFELMHVKDEMKSEDGPGEMNNGYDSTILSHGVLPLKKILDKAEAQEIKYYFIEQESYQGLPPIACAGKNFKQMKRWEF